MVLVVTFSVAEVSVRIFFRYNTPDTVRENSIQYLPTVSARSRLKPDQHIKLDEAWGGQPQAGHEGLVYKINQHGYRGQNFSLRKRKGTTRIVVLGGSAVFDPKAQTGRDWPHLVENLLHASGLEHVEVINAGIPGHASADAVGKLYSQVWMLEPDYTIFCNTWNDLKYFSQLSMEKPLASMVKPHDESNDPFRNYQGVLDRFFSQSQLYAKLRTRYFLHKINVGPEGVVPKREPATHYTELAVEQFTLNVKLFVDASRNIGAIPILLTQASLLSAETSAVDRKRIAYRYLGLTHEAAVEASTACHHAVREVARAKQAALLDLAAKFSSRSELFADHVHLNAMGSETIAKALAEFLAQHLTARHQPSSQPHARDVGSFPVEPEDDLQVDRERHAIMTGKKHSTLPPTSAEPPHKVPLL